eukprot:TRINITY_DN5682_c0_g1_i1.p1 TRINITY_DN5682_c0_g1~~TRINITY_DN5682_c0_g1_i1.p1  ORF type:complete len:438 (-),score=143.52 TRINITY_DN5682_c0_g1_i1:231-1544(-)
MTDVSKFYGMLSKEQQKDFETVVVSELRTLIGGFGELSVLAEYISVMLQSSRPADQIQTELEAFLQEQSQPFTNWLFEQLQARVEGKEGGKKKQAAEGEALLQRAVREARQGAGVEEKPARKKKVKEGKEPKEGKEKREKRSKLVAAPGPAAPAPPPGAVAVAALQAHREKRKAPGEERSRSRKRRRRREADAADEAGNGAGKKAVLTPKSKLQAAADAVAAPPPADARWSFRAEPGAAPAAPYAGYTPPGGHPPPAASAPGPPPASMLPPAALPGVGAPQKAPRVPNHMIRKWKVIRSKVVVKATEALESPEVQVLQEGEIVEQVAPAFELPNGIVRIQIRHPSSPHFPNPIGWVTQDATKAGGPVFLEPGPKPMDERYQPKTDASRRWTAPSYPPPTYPSWRPPRPGGPPARAPMASRNASGTFANLTWTPGAKA